MNMNIGKKEVSLLLIVLGIVIVIGAYYLGVRKLQAKTNAVNGENGTLQTEMDALNPVREQEEFYITEKDRMEKEVSAILKKYPANYQAEDEILYDVYLEGKVGCYINYLTTADGYFLGNVPGEREDVLAGTPDVTGSIAANSDKVNTENLLVVDGILMKQTTSANTMTVTYNQFKDLAKTILADENVKSIDNIVLSYDESTGNLTGSMDINYFSMTGTERVYVEPSTGVIGYGVDTIFGALLGEPMLGSQYINNNVVMGNTNPLEAAAN